jgi:hypothetical protein
LSAAVSLPIPFGVEVEVQVGQLAAAVVEVQKGRMQTSGCRNGTTRIQAPGFRSQRARCRILESGIRREELLNPEP